MPTMPPQQVLRPASRTHSSVSRRSGVFARVDDLAVELRRRIEIVVVVVETGLLQRIGLRLRQHAERRAGFHAERLHRADHRGDLRDVAILRRAPRRAHAETRRAGGLRLLRLGEHRIEAHQLFGFDAGRVARGLRAVRAVLGTAAGLDRQQRRHLHRVRVVVRAMHRVGAREQVGERQIHQRRDFGAGPVVAEGGGRHAKLPAGETSGNGKARVSI